MYTHPPGRERTVRRRPDVRLRPHHPSDDDDASQHDHHLRVRRGREAAAGLDGPAGEPDDQLPLGRERGAAADRAGERWQQQRAARLHVRSATRLPDGGQQHIVLPVRRARVGRQPRVVHRINAVDVVVRAVRPDKDGAKGERQPARRLHAVRGRVPRPHRALPPPRQAVRYPASGRFLGRDPIPGPPADPYVSAYVYADNAPTVLLDPSGEFPCPRSICDPLKQLARGISRQRGKAAAAGFAFVGSAALYVAGGVATAGCLGAAEADPLLVIHCYGIAVFFGSGGIALAVSGGILIGDVYRAGAASRRRETVVGTPLQDLQDDNLGHNGR